MQIFPANAIASVITIYTLLHDAFSSNPNTQFEILKKNFHFHILIDFMKGKQRKVISVHISVNTVMTRMDEQ